MPRFSEMIFVAVPLEVGVGVALGYTFVRVTPAVGSAPVKVSISPRVASTFLLASN